VHPQGDKVDVLIALNEAAFHGHKADHTPQNGVLIHPNVRGAWKGTNTYGGTRYVIDFHHIARQAVGNSKSKDVVVADVLAVNR
jgi:hypothetical protein